MRGNCYYGMDWLDLGRNGGIFEGGTSKAAFTPVQLSTPQRVSDYPQSDALPVLAILRPPLRGHPQNVCCVGNRTDLGNDERNKEEIMTVLG